MELADDLVTPYKRTGKATAGYHLNLFRGYDAAYECWCYEHLTSFLPKQSTVVEWFGGLGIGSIIIQKLLQPWRHVIYEHDKWLCQHLETVPELGPCYVCCGDSYEAEPEYGGTIHVVDNNSFTIRRWLKDEQYAAFMDKVFCNSEYVLFTDTAVCIFWPHRERYAQALGTPRITSLADYLHGLSRRVDEHYGQRIVVAATHPRASYLLFAKHGYPFTTIVRPPKEARDYLCKL